MGGAFGAGTRGAAARAVGGGPAGRGGPDRGRAAALGLLRLVQRQTQTPAQAHRAGVRLPLSSRPPRRPGRRGRPEVTDAAIPNLPGPARRTSIAMPHAPTLTQIIKDDDWFSPSWRAAS